MNSYSATQVINITETELTRTMPTELKRHDGGVFKLGSRRARAACTLCRWKKVRCDAEEGQRCSNCVFEDVQCVLTQKRARKKASLRTSPSAARNSIQKPASVVDDSSVNPSKSGDDGPQQQNEHFARSILPHTTQLTQSKSPPKLDMLENTVQWDVNSPDWDHAANESLPTPVSPNPSIGLSNAGKMPSSYGQSLSEPITPAFLKPIPPHLAMEDVDYLKRKGALTVPDSLLRDGLLRSYIEFIHPCLPLLDIHAFQASLENPSVYGQISFPLFQAVLFAGSAWADIKLLRELGYLTRKAARKAFYLRARSLYDADYEQDRICIVQTLVLLTLWWEGPNEHKDGWHWSGLSISLARNIGLNRDAKRPSVDPAVRKLRRRLWWCCVMRDTIAAFGSNRAPRIRNGEFDVSMLTTEDFELFEPVSPETRWAAAKDIGCQIQRATTCIRMAKICCIISHILHLGYGEDFAGRTATLYSSQELDASESTPLPNKTQVNVEQLSMCEEDLHHWKEETPDFALHQSPIPNVSHIHEQAALVHRAMLSMLYFTAILTLHRPRILPNSSIPITEPSLTIPEHDPSRRIIRYASVMINQIVMDLYKADLMRLLPATGISCLIPVSVSHLFDMKSSDEDIRREGFRRLEECKQALRELVDAHVAAEWAINFLSFAASQIKHTSGSKRKVTGMVTGDIVWNVPSQPQSTGTVPSCLSDDTNNLTETNLIPLGSRHFGGVQTGSFPVGQTVGNSGLSPDDLANSINFPEMWLNFGPNLDPLLDVDWIESNAFSCNFTP